MEQTQVQRLVFQFTPDQTKALEHNGNVAISAGAGSGKTRVLVEKYFRLLVDEHPDWPVDSVIAITFTVKAAAELRDRIVKKLLDEMKYELKDTPRYARLVQVRREIIVAPIGTIHSLCSRILKLYPFEARLNPDFSVVEEAHKASLLNQAVQTGLEKIIKNESSQEHDDLLILLTLYKKTVLMKQLERMLSNRSDFLLPAERLINVPTQVLLEELKRQIEDAVSVFSETPVRRIEAALKGLVVASGGGPLGKECDLILDECFRAVKVSIKEIYEVIETRLLTKGKLTPRKKLLSKDKVDEDNELFKEIAKQLKQLPFELDRPISPLDQRALERTARIARIFLVCHKEYVSLRGAEYLDNEADLLDFPDLELRTELLLRKNPEVVQKLQQQFRFLIVDEFQDTSELQWSILGKIVTDPSSNILLKNRLFIVGDPKQGVYGFRNANILLFDRLSDEIKQQDGCVVMATNFRTVGVPLDVVNVVFESLLKKDENRFAVEFQKLDAARAKDKGAVFVLEIQESSGDGESDPIPTGQDLFNLNGPLYIADEAIQESDVVADHIESMVRSGAYKPGDIAILFRRRRHFYEYELALQKRKIPVVVQNSSSLFHQTEISDFIALLQLIVQPGNDLYTLQFLRGMYCNFSDELLLKISLCRGRWFLEKMQNALVDKEFDLDGTLIKFLKDEVNQLNFISGLVSQLSIQANTNPIDVLIKKAIDLLGARIIAGAGKRGGRAVENLNLLVDIAWKFREEGLASFLYYIEGEENIDRGTEEAPFDEGVNAVKIMTIHASKGLEFPVVYLPTLGVPLRTRTEMIETDGELWMSITATALDEGVKPLINSYLRYIDKLKFISEEKRLLYVAFTRCREELILSADLRSQKSFSSDSLTCFNWIKPVIEDKIIAQTKNFQYPIGKSQFDGALIQDHDAFPVEEEMPADFANARQNAVNSLLHYQSLSQNIISPTKKSRILRVESEVLTNESRQWKKLLRSCFTHRFTRPDSSLNDFLEIGLFPFISDSDQETIINGFNKLFELNSQRKISLEIFEQAHNTENGPTVCLSPIFSLKDEHSVWFLIAGPEHIRLNLMDEYRMAIGKATNFMKPVLVKAFDVNKGTIIEL